MKVAWWRWLRGVLHEARSLAGHRHCMSTCLRQERGQSPQDCEHPPAALEAGSHKVRPGLSQPTYSDPNCLPLRHGILEPPNSIRSPSVCSMSRFANVNHLHAWHWQPPGRVPGWWLASRSRSTRMCWGLFWKLSHVAGTIRCLQQVRLRAAPKWTQMLDCGDASVHKHLQFYPNWGKQ